MMARKEEEEDEWEWHALTYGLHLSSLIGKVIIVSAIQVWIILSYHVIIKTSNQYKLNRQFRKQSRHDDRLWIIITDIISDSIEHFI